MFEITGKYTTATIYATTIEESAIAQIITLCNQPMFEGASIKIMPDCHTGAGCVIGFTAIIEREMVVPNLIGVDIGCGVYTTIFKTNSPIDFKSLDDFIRNNIPSGFAVRGSIHPNMNPKIIDMVETVSANIGCEDKINRHLLSCGSLGGGNHYIEVGTTGRENEYALSIHTGSRNLGKMVCEFYQNKASTIDEELKNSIIAKHKTAITAEEHQKIQDELSNLPKVPKELAYLTGENYHSYVKDMIMCRHFAAENRRLITDSITGFVASNFGFYEINKFDTIHNYIESVNGKLIARKGAIAAYNGCNVAIPLNMRDGVIIGIGKGNPDWNFSAPHGAGRLMSRSEAKKNLEMKDFEEAMNGIQTWSVCENTIDESPMAYKPAEEIIDAVKDTIDIVDIVKPVYNFKASE